MFVLLLPFLPDLINGRNQLNLSALLHYLPIPPSNFFFFSSFAFTPPEPHSQSRVRLRCSFLALLTLHHDSFIASACISTVAHLFSSCHLLTFVASMQPTEVHQSTPPA